jgi:hypothetical protein
MKKNMLLLIAVAVAVVLLIIFVAIFMMAPEMLGIIPPGDGGGLSEADLPPLPGPPGAPSP